MMNQTKSVAVIIVAYKDKNLRAMVDDIRSKSKHDVRFNVFDQNAIDHRNDFKDIEESCSYEHKIWDDIAGPCKARYNKFHDMRNEDYVCMISPDITLPYGWDEYLINYIDSASVPVVVSGAGAVNVTQPNLFDIKAEWIDSDDYRVTNFIDRNFIFASREAFNSIEYPEFLKYAGEQEYLSMAFLSQGYEIHSMPTHLISDSKERSIETKYCTWSREHNYNVVVGIIKGKDLEQYKINESGRSKFLNSYNIDPDSINYLPYQTNDVSYDPYKIKIHDVDARRFIVGVKAIY
jgi:hypothetical protein